MGVTAAFGVVFVFACLAHCRGQYNPFSDLSSLSHLFQALQYGRQTVAPLAPRQTVQPSQYSETVTTKQPVLSSTRTAPSNSYSKLLGLLANRWGGIEQRIENRIETLPDHAADAAEQRVDKASDYFENVQEQQQTHQQQSQISTGWNNQVSQPWGSTYNNADDRLEQMDNNMEQRIDQIENTYGEQVAENAENRWDTAKDVIEDTIDTVTDDNSDDDDYNDDYTDDWNLSFDSYDDSNDVTNDNNDWSATQSLWDYDSQDDGGWGSFSYSY